MIGEMVRLTLVGIFASSRIRRPFLTCVAELKEFLEKGEACSNLLKTFRNHSFSCPSLRGRSVLGLFLLDLRGENHLFPPVI